MAEYVEGVEVVLADGSVVEFENDFDPKAGEREAASIAERCLAVLSGKEGVIAEALPASRRNRSGYNIAGICHDGKIDLARLLVGSEGTLGIFTKITLRTVSVPSAKGLLQLEFDSLAKMAGAVPIIVESGAAACELMDKRLIDMAIEALPEYRDVFPAGAAAVLLVEHIGETEEEVKEKIERTDSAVGARAAERKIVFEAEAQERLWKSRKDAVPLLDRKKGRKHPVPFVEDVCVGKERLGEYISGLEEIGKRYDISMSFYGHAGDGELHIRPYLDLSEPEEVKKMRSIADDVFSLAWSLCGSISGEHADGLVRAAFIKRQYGDEFYGLLCDIKDIFDAEGLMNPGKIISKDPDVMVGNLRAESKLLPERLFEKTGLHFGKDEVRFEIGQCNGCGVCLSRESDLRMCPVFRALGEELGSSRAKANVLHFWATGRLSEKDFESGEFRKFLDLCINCKACSLQCPSGVDIGKLMTAARAEYVRVRGLRRGEMVLSRNRELSVLGSIFAPVSNFVMRLGVSKWLLEKIGGVDRRRKMPSFRRGSFLASGRKYLDTRAPIEAPIDKVVYFVDTYANYNDHELGFAVLDVLRANDIEVILPEQRPVPLPAIVYGDVKTARKDLSFNVKYLAKTVREGYKIVCSEPSAALCLKEELRYFVAGEDAKLVSENTYELMSYLFSLLEQNKLKPVKNPISRAFVYHNPCHLFAMGGGRASIELLKRLCPVMVVDLEAGCCGLAGMFGFNKKNYDLSSKIAERLAEALESYTARYVLTECSACKMQIEHISDAMVVHPIKILARCYDV
jgi:anaerobic glycerol-3-phosphate dehydrogenase C subunit